MKLRWKDVSTAEGLALTGQADSRRGHVLVSQGPIKVKRYAFRRRVGDGHVLVRWGRLVGARACWDETGALLSVTFNVQARAS